MASLATRKPPPFGGSSRSVSRRTPCVHGSALADLRRAPRVSQSREGRAGVGLRPDATYHASSRPAAPAPAATPAASASARISAAAAGPAGRSPSISTLWTISDATSM